MSRATRSWCFIVGGLAGELECHLEHAVELLEKKKAKEAKEHVDKARSLTYDAFSNYPISILRQLRDETKILSKELAAGRASKEILGRANSALKKAEWARQRAGDLCS